MNEPFREVGPIEQKVILHEDHPAFPVTLIDVDPTANWIKHVTGCDYCVRLSDLPDHYTMAIWEGQKLAWHTVSEDELLDCTDIDDIECLLRMRVNEAIETLRG